MALSGGVGLSNCAFAQAETAAAKSSSPVDFRTSRVEIRNEYQDLQGEGKIDYLVPRFDISAGPDLSFRVETPIVFSHPDKPGNDGESGIGDLLFRGSYRLAHGPGYAIVAGGELIPAAKKEKRAAWLPVFFQHQSLTASTSIMIVTSSPTAGT